MFRYAAIINLETKRPENVLCHVLKGRSLIPPMEGVSQDAQKATFQNSSHVLADKHVLKDNLVTPI